MDIADKIEFVKSTLSPMAWHTHPYISSVLGIESNHSCRHVGSAVRVLAGGRRCVVTAVQVIEQAQATYGRFAVTATRGGAPFELHGAPERLSPKHNIAAYLLPDDYPGEEVLFWPLELIDRGDEQLSTDFLFVHGFPASRSVVSALAGGIVNRSFPYGVMQREDAVPDDIEPFQFVMDFDPENMFDGDGHRADWLDPQGLTGSPIWRIGASGRRVDTWSPDLSLLVGVVTQWRPKERFLVATRSRYLLEMLEMI